MGKKQDAYYFSTFVACADDACRAAHLLRDVLENFKPETVEAQLEKLHEIEHSGDMKNTTSWIIWRKNSFRRLRGRISFPSARILIM